MLNLYDRVFSLLNYKLYQSPYKKNIDEVWDVLKNFKLRSRLLFLNNMRTLKIEEVHDSELDEWGTAASYFPFKNSIHIYQNVSENLNHELFHASSRGLKGFTGVMDYGGGDELTEGITEYLAMKSRGKTITTSAYEENVFVIEFLVFIYGDEFINYYLQNRVDGFHQYFLDNHIHIDILDSLLSKISNHKEYNENRRLYLLISDIVPGVIEDDIDFLMELKLDRASDFQVKTKLKDSYDLYCEGLEQYKKKCVNVSDDELYVYQDSRKEEVLNFYIEDYCEKQNVFFEKILDILIELAEQQQNAHTSIDLFLEKSFQNKTNEFRHLYGDRIPLKCNGNYRKR